jgi:NitT/TauT family transport system permease protein
MVFLSPDRSGAAVLMRLARRRYAPNRADLIALLLIAAGAVLIVHGADQMGRTLPELRAAPIVLDPSRLPGYALLTTLRMFAAIIASLLFTFVVATLAAKSKKAEMIIVPALDILQSVPVLGFLTFTLTFFMGLFPGRELGVECASIFLVFTAQAWNMAFSFYQSLRTLPGDLDEVSRQFGLSPWRRFIRLELPFATPALVWNTMMSMSGGWFFVVASEAITLGDNTWTLPGIGAYVAMALDRKDLAAVFWAIGAMLLVILAYDQLLFRPLVAWSARFRFETTASAITEDPWVLALLRRTHMLRIAGEALERASAWATGLRLGRPLRMVRRRAASSRLGDAGFAVVIAAGVAWVAWQVVAYIGATLSWTDLGQVLLLGTFTLTRVLTMMALASAIWVPIGVWIGLRPTWAQRVQPVAQFLAAFPANLLFPPFVVVIVRFHLNVDVFLTPLMVLGTQWYILFNVIAGASAFPGDLREAAENFRVGGLLWWRRVIFPGILPYFVTGAITASGGSWNASIVAEVAAWGDNKLAAHGLGAYIARATDAGDFHQIVLGVVVMSLYVVLFNRLLWRPLYAYASRRTTLG